MVYLEHNYISYINDIKKGYPKAWLFRPLVWWFFKRYRGKLKKRLVLLEEQYSKGLITKAAYNIWKKMIKQVL